MKRRDLLAVVGVAIVTGILTFFLASIVFSSKRFSSKVPVIDTINSSFPDIKNDSAYNSFLNSNALDLTQPVQIGNNQNQTPFGNSPQ